MPILTIKSHLSTVTCDILVEDWGVSIPFAGGQESFDEIQEIRLAQRSYSLRTLLTDNVFGLGESTLIIDDGTGGDVPQGQVLDLLDAYLQPQKEVDEFDIAGLTPVDFILTEVPLLESEVIYLNGQRQRKGALHDYTISGDTVTMIHAIRAGDVVSVEYHYI